MTRTGRGTEPAVVWLGAFAIAAALHAPLLASGEASGPADWPQFHHWWEVSRVALTRWGEWPLWDPYHCGGVPMWGQPQAMYAAPTWWVTGLLFGTARGSELFVVLHAAIGLAGTWFLARGRWGIGRPGAALSAVTWALGGFFAWRVAQGHATFLAFHYLPWCLLALHRAAADLRWSVALAGLLTLMLLEGGTYAFPFTLLAIGWETAAAVIAEPRRRAGALRAAVVGVGLAAWLGAIRIWPIMRVLRRFPRPTALRDAQTLREVLVSLSAPEPPEIWTHPFSWSEHGAFVGIGALALAAAGALLALRDRRRWPLLGGALLFGALAMGDAGILAPWTALHRLPVFDSLHVPSRFHGVLTLYLALLAGLALDSGARFLRAAGAPRGPLLAASWLVVAALAIDVAAHDLRVLAPWRGPPIGGARAARFHLVSGEDYLERFASYPARHVGTASCYDPVPWDVPATLWEGDSPQARIVPARAGTLEGERRTGSTYRATVTLGEPARLQVNQRYAPGWIASVGEVVDERGRLAVRLPAGRHRLRLRYAPSDLPFSLLASGFGALACLALLLGGRRRLLSRAPPGKAGPP